ncbi:MAG: pitrilysin family protein [Rhodothermales bacterium]|nr:pitrilysin family protein [Rhodothermales bacterium]
MAEAHSAPDTATPDTGTREHPSTQTPNPPDAFDFLEASGGIEAYRLKANGLRVLVLPEAAAPVATLMVTYHVGSRDERTGLTGATHFLEHLMFKGTARYHKREGTAIFHTLQRVGARINATTWLDRTNYYELLPKEYLPLALDIEADRMRGALLDDADLESERTVILNEYDRGKNEPLRNLYHAVWSHAFVAHPYHHPTIGWRSDIETVTASGLRHFYDTYYWPDNATLSIIGDVETGAVLELVAEYFGGIPAAPAPIPEVTTREPEQHGERRFVLREAGQLGALMLGFKAPRGLDADADALDLLAMVLASGKSSRLYRRLTDQGLAAQVSASMPRLRDPGLFYVFALLSPGRTHEEVEAAIAEVLADVRDAGVTEVELERARNQLRAQEAFGRDGPYAIAAQLNEAIAAGDWTLYTTFLDRIARVTPDDLLRAARTYLVEDRCTVGWFIPAGGAEEEGEDAD